MKADMNINIKTSAVLFITFLVHASGMPLAQETAPAPEAASGRVEKGLVVALKHMVAAAHPLASEAGLEILRGGGSAVDAAIAVQLVLGLVEPQSSGLGGGAFLVHWENGRREVKTYDGRETAPAAAKPDRFLVDGRPMAFGTAVRSGLSVGVPGTVRLLAHVHQRHGKADWRALFAPAMRLARDGFPMPERLHTLLALSEAQHFSEGARRYFYAEDGQAKPAGSIIKNPEYADTLEQIARGGAKAFYEGAIAEAIAKAVADAPTGMGGMTRADIAAYQVIERDPVCVHYRGNKICGMGPPSSGALTVAQTLKLIEPFGDIQGAYQRLSPQALHIIAEAEKLAFADRNRYIADPAFTSVPSGFLDDNYLAERRKLISRTRAMEKAEPGLPPGTARKSNGVDATRELPGTSHISIVDGAGNAVAMTTTIEGGFGSHLWAAGFLLNNELTDFSFSPTDAAGEVIANRVEGGKRPRSSMAPTLVFDAQGDLKAVTGSPGGSRIILYVAKTLIALLDWDMDAAGATSLANFGSQGRALELERGQSVHWTGEMLKAYGHEVASEPMTSGIHTIVRRNGRLEGGADPRREGVALGD